MSEDPLVSAIIPAYNAERWIDRTLASAVAQTYPDIEILVVDDGSTDRTASIVEAAASRDGRIRLLRKPHSGLPATRNFGIAQAKGALIAPLDADDLWHPEKLARQVARMQASSPQVGLVYCWAAEIDENDFIIPPLHDGSVAEGRVLTELVAKAGLIDSASNPMMRRSWLDAAGGYDENQTLGAEDWKLYLTLASICDFAVVPAHLVGYRRSAGSMSRKIVRMDQAMTMVGDWIMQTMPDVPKEVTRQMKFNRNGYLAHLALTTNDFANALRYQLRSYAVQPAALLAPSSAVFCMRLLARLVGIRRADWFRTKPIHFNDIEITPAP